MANDSDGQRFRLDQGVEDRFVELNRFLWMFCSVVAYGLEGLANEFRREREPDTKLRKLYSRLVGWGMTIRNVTHSTYVTGSARHPCEEIQQMLKTLSKAQTTVHGITNKLDDLVQRLEEADDDPDDVDLTPRKCLRDFFCKRQCVIKQRVNELKKMIQHKFPTDQQ